MRMELRALTPLIQQVASRYLIRTRHAPRPAPRCSDKRSTRLRSKMAESRGRQQWRLGLYPCVASHLALHQESSLLRKHQRGEVQTRQEVPPPAKLRSSRERGHEVVKMDGMGSVEEKMDEAVEKTIR